MQNASTWARTQLKSKFYNEYMKYYKEGKGIYLHEPSRRRLSKASNYAITTLVEKHRTWYNKFYEEAKVLGYPVQLSAKGKIKESS